MSGNGGGRGKEGGDKLRRIGEAFALQVMPKDWYDVIDGKREILEVSVPAEFVNKFREELSVLDEGQVKEFASATVLHLAVLGIKVVAQRLLASKLTDDFADGLIDALKGPLIIKVE